MLIMSISGAYGINPKSVRKSGVCYPILIDYPWSTPSPTTTIQYIEKMHPEKIDAASKPIIHVASLRLSNGSVRKKIDGKKLYRRYGTAAAVTSDSPGRDETSLWRQMFASVVMPYQWKCPCRRRRRRRRRWQLAAVSRRSDVDDGFSDAINALDRDLVHLVLV